MNGIAESTIPAAARYVELMDRIGIAVGVVGVLLFVQSVPQLYKIIQIRRAQLGPSWNYIPLFREIVVTYYYWGVAGWDVRLLLFWKLGIPLMVMSVLILWVIR